MAIITSCVQTFIDLNEISIGDISPISPSNNQLWFCTKNNGTFLNNMLYKYNSSASKWEIVNDYTDEILEAIKNLNVTSRNLLSDTAVSKSLWCTGIINQCGAKYSLVKSVDYLKHLRNNKLTYAFDWEYIGDNPGGTFVAQTAGPQWTQISKTITISADNYWGTCVDTITFTSENPFIEIGIRADNVIGTVKITHPRLVFGEKDLGWSQAPEDLEEKFTTIFNRTDKGIYMEHSGGGTTGLIDVNNKAIKISAPSLFLEGYTTINEHFKVLPTGDIEGTNAKFNGTITSGGTISGTAISGGTLIGSTIQNAVTNPTFKVTPAGAMTANNATIKGTISGSIISGETFTSANNKFKVLGNGTLEATEANITGSISAGSTITGSTVIGSTIQNAATNPTFVVSNTGNIKGAVITGSSFQNSETSPSFKVDVNGRVDASNMNITGGSLNVGSNFNVSNTGILTAKSANFTGSINAGSTITGSIIQNAVSNPTFKIDASGNITGGSININNAFNVNSAGKLIATGAEISGKVTIGSGSTVPTSYLSGTVSSAQLDKTITNDISTAKASANDANNKIDNLEIGGTNLLLNTSFLDGLSSWSANKGVLSIVDTPNSPSGKCIKGVASASGQGLFQQYTPKSTGEYTISFWGRADSTLPFYFCQEGPSIRKDVILTTTWQKFTHTFNRDNLNTNAYVFYPQAAGTFYIHSIKVEKGNKVTDWSKAPEDIEKEILDVSNSLNTLDTSVKNAFGDGIINDSEAKALASNIQILDNEKSDIDREYTTVLGNAKLDGTAKSHLSSTKNAYDSAHASLKSNINTVIANNIITSEEQASVNSFFTTYRSKLADYKQRLQEALDYISDKKIDNIEIGGRNIIENSAFSDGIKYSPFAIGGPNISVSIVQDVTHGNVLKITNPTNINGGIHTGSYLPTRNLIGNAKYSYSAWVKADNDTVVYMGLQGSSVAKSTEFNISTSWQRITVEGEKYIADNPSFRFYTSSTVPFYMAKPMLEQSTKCANWSPAPEDLDKSIKGVKDIADKASATLDSNKVNWSTAYKQIESWAESTPTGTTEFDGNKIKTGTIFANKMAIGDFTNICQIDENRNPVIFPKVVNASTTSVITHTDNKKYFKFGHSTIAGYYGLVLINDMQILKVGDTFKFNCTGFSTSSAIKIVMRVTYTDNSYTDLGASGVSASSKIAPINAIIKINSDIDTTKTIKGIACFIHNNNTIGLTYLRSISINRMSTGELIVDGSITSSMIHTDGLDANTIKTGTLDANRIAANSITTQHLVIGDFSNYCPITPDNCSKFGYRKIVDTTYGDWIQLDTPARDMGLCSSLYEEYTGNVSGTYRISATFSTTVKGVVNKDTGVIDYLRVSIGLYCTLKDNTTKAWYVPAGVLSNSTGSVQKFDATVTIPENVKSFGVALQHSGWGSFSGVTKVKDIVVNKMMTGDLIVNNAITANKIAANSITSDLIHANGITADKIKTGKLTASSGGSYLDLNNGSMMLGSTSSANYLQWTGSSLIVKADSISMKVGGSVATVTDVNSSIDKIQYGGRNLILKSNEPIETSTYEIKTYDLTEDLIAGEEYTFVIKGSVVASQKFGIWMNRGSTNVGYATTKFSEGVYYVSFKAGTPNSEANKRTLSLYNYPSSTTASTVEWVALYRGNKPLDWTAAPEDIDQNISDAVKMETEDGEVVYVKDQVSDITQDLDGITNKVSKIEVEFDDDGTVGQIKTQVSSLQQTADGFTLDFFKKIEDADANTKEILSHISFTADGIVLGQDTYPTKLIISKDKIKFVAEDGSELAYFSDNKLLIQNSEILDTLKIANYGFLPNAGGSLTIGTIK